MSEIYDITEKLKRKILAREQYVRYMQLELKCSYSEETLNEYDIETIEVDKDIKRDMRVIMMAMAAIGTTNRFIDFDDNISKLDTFKKFTVIIDRGGYMEKSDLNTFASAYEMEYGSRELWSLKLLTIHPEFP